MSVKRAVVGVDTPVHLGAARLLAVRWSEFVRTLRRARRDGASDPGKISSERVHAVRVTARRVVVAMRVFGPLVEKRDARRARAVVRGLRRAAGVLRDCDVHLALLTDLASRDAAGRLPAIAHAVGQVERERLVARTHLLDAVTSMRPEAVARLARDLVRGCLREDPRGDTASDGTIGDFGMSTLARVSGEALDAASRDLAHPEHLHALRLAVKRVRYTCEIFGGVLPESSVVVLHHLIKAQQVLGEVNDLATLVDRLARMHGEVCTLHESELPGRRSELRDGLESLHAGFSAVRDHRARQAVAWWATEGLADALRPLVPYWSPGATPEAPVTAPPSPPAPTIARTLMEKPPMTDTAVMTHANGRHATGTEPTAAQGNLWLAGKRFAVIDIGSNSIRLLVVELIDGVSWRVLAEERSMTRLAQGMARTGEISAEAMARSVEAIGRFKAQAEKLGVTRVRAFATAAVREAANRQDFVSLVFDRAGLGLELVSELDEGRLTHRSVARVFDLTEGDAAVADIGGGSLEVVLSQRGIITENTSMPLGAVRVTEAFGGADACAGPRFKAMRRHIERFIAARVRKPEVPPAMLIGCGGTFTTLLTLAAAARGVMIDRGSPALAGLGPVSRAQIRAVLDELRALSLEERLRVPGLPSDRADIVIAGLTVIDRLLAHLGLSQVHVHPGGFREGLLLRMIDQAALEQDRSELDSSDADHMTAVRNFATRCRYDRAHSEHVATLALRLFDQFREESVLIPDLGSAAHERLMLEAAAVLHDIGIMVGYARHHKHSRTMIRHAELRGFTERETDLIAHVARYHRRTPPRRRHAEFSALPDRDQSLVRRLAALLRVADGLDRAHAQNVRDVRVRFGSGKVLLEVEAGGDVSVDIAAADRKGDLLRDVLGQKVRIELPG
ncbi:MAG: hypothetical protein HBSAPP03_22490 [Phycisphaerae bacterium]|nr:MAG: hypothetical protein HBSAPP03_22490 [Phycisphaerae bacterium]